MGCTVRGRPSEGRLHVSFSERCVHAFVYVFVYLCVIVWSTFVYLSARENPARNSVRARRLLGYQLMKTKLLLLLLSVYGGVSSLQLAVSVYPFLLFIDDTHLISVRYTNNTLFSEMFHLVSAFNFQSSLPFPALSAVTDRPLRKKYADIMYKYHSLAYT